MNISPTVHAATVESRAALVSALPAALLVQFLSALDTWKFGLATEQNTGYVDGSPAHAGIDPSRIPAWSDHGGFPRPRGDRPEQGMELREIAAVPPPTRG